MDIKHVTVSGPDRKYSKARIYIHPQDETVMDNLMSRKERPHSIYRKEVLPKLFKQLGWDADTRVKWSQYAGCSCPCSPGFVVDNIYGRNVFVDVG